MGRCANCCNWIVKSAYSRQFLLTIIPIFILIVLIIHVNSLNRHQMKQTTEKVFRLAISTVTDNFRIFFEAKHQFIEVVKKAIHSGVWDEPADLEAFTQFVLPVMDSHRAFRSIFASHNDGTYCVAMRSAESSSTVYVSGLLRPVAYPPHVQDEVILFRTHVLPAWAKNPNSAKSGDNTTLWPNWMYSTVSRPYDFPFQKEWYVALMAQVSSSSSQTAQLHWYRPYELNQTQVSAPLFDDSRSVSKSFSVLFPFLRDTTASAKKEQALFRVVANETVLDRVFQDLPANVEAVIVDAWSKKIVSYKNSSSFYIGNSISSISNFSSLASMSSITLFNGFIITNSGGSALIASPLFTDEDGKPKKGAGIPQWVLVSHAMTTSPGVAHNFIQNRISHVLEIINDAAESLSYLVTSRTLEDIDNPTLIEKFILPFLFTVQDVVQSIEICSPHSATGSCFKMYFSPDGQENGRQTAVTEWYPLQSTQSAVRPRSYDLSSETGTFDNWQYLSSPFIVPPFLYRFLNIQNWKTSSSVETPVLHIHGNGVREWIVAIPFCLHWPWNHFNTAKTFNSCFRFAFATAEVDKVIRDLHLDQNGGSAAIVYDDGTVLASGRDSNGLNQAPMIWEVVSTSASPIGGNFRAVSSLQEWEQLKALNGQPTQPYEGFTIRVVPVLQSTDSSRLWLFLVVDENISSTSDIRFAIRNLDGLVFLALFLFAIHGAHFIHHMKSLNSLHFLLDAVTELRLDLIEEDKVVNTACYANDDLQSMQTSILQLYRTMKELKPYLGNTLIQPWDHRVERRSTTQGQRPEVTDPTAVQSPPTGNEEATTRNAPPAAPTVLPPPIVHNIFTGLKEQRLNILEERAVVLLTIYLPGVEILEVPEESLSFYNVLNSLVQRKYRGTIHPTNVIERGVLQIHCSFASHLKVEAFLCAWELRNTMSMMTSKAIGTAVASSEQKWVLLTLVDAPCFGGNVGSRRTLRFALGGQAIQTASLLSSFYRQTMVNGEDPLCVQGMSTSEVQRQLALTKLPFCTLLSDRKTVEGFSGLASVSSQRDIAEKLLRYRLIGRVSAASNLQAAAVLAAVNATSGAGGSTTDGSWDQSIQVMEWLTQPDINLASTKLGDVVKLLLQRPLKAVTKSKAIQLLTEVHANPTEEEREGSYGKMDSLILRTEDARLHCLLFLASNKNRKPDGLFDVVIDEY